MWNEGGQIAHLVFAGVRGGGKGGGGGGGADPLQSKPIILTDPVDGTTFVQESNPYLLAMSSNMPQPRSAQEQLNEHIAQRKAQEQATSDQQKQAAADTATQGRNDFNTRLADAITGARTSVNQYFTQQGVDPTRYGSEIETAINRGKSLVPDLSPNPASAFDANLGQTILNDITSGRRTQASNTVSNLFGPTYASDRLGYTADDSYINDILNEQFNPVNTSLGYARDRGTLTPQGFSAATDALNQKRTAAQSTLQSLGQGIIDTDRLSVNDLITGAKNTASSLNPNAFDTFNPASFRTQADELVGSKLSSLPGDLRNAVGATKYVDLNELLNVGGSAQGPTQPSITNPAAGVGGIDPAIADQAKRNQEKRGLGSTGAF